MFWYVARNSRGEEGTIPITFVEVSLLDSNTDRVHTNTF